MKGRVLGKPTNKYKTRVAVSIIPLSIAKSNWIKWRPLDKDEPNNSSVTGTELTTLGQINIWIKFNTLKKAQEILALVCKEESKEYLVDLESLPKMVIIH